MDKKPSLPDRVKWYPNTLDIVKGWSDAAKQNIGGDLRRLENDEAPTDRRYLGDGLNELRDHQENIWYRLVYGLHAGWIWVLHCFEKKTNETPKDDLKLAGKRFDEVKSWNVEPYPRPKSDDDSGRKEKKSA